ncbi:hypothetical protein F5X96DRAFT_641057 [Biscogniauxia mediterranea]|nr:hypothetical protein F5X96DRAFT_641057 [Biscogniauxia mediterranea]
MSHHTNHSRQLTIDFCQSISEFVGQAESLGDFVNPDDFREAKGLQKFQVVRTGLDLITGEPADGGMKFFQPLSPEEVYSMLEKNNIKIADDTPTDPEDVYNIEGGWNLLADIRDYADLQYANSPNSVWKAAEFPQICKRIQEAKGNHRDRRYDIRDGYDIQDGKTTHISCVVVLDYRFEDEKLARAELISITSTTLEKLSEPGFEDHLYCPVLLISVASRQLRIISALVDGSTSTIYIQVTPIITFNERFLARRGLGEGADKTARILGWQFGNPCGDTK